MCQKDLVGSVIISPPILAWSKQVSWWLRNYEDILERVDIYSLIALTSFLNKVVIHSFAELHLRLWKCVEITICSNILYEILPFYKILNCMHVHINILFKLCIVVKMCLNLISS